MNTKLYSTSMATRAPMLLRWTVAPEAAPPLLLAELKRLRAEITRLNVLVSDLTLDNGILQDVARLCSHKPEPGR